jgi:hypothetical protein
VARIYPDAKIARHPIRFFVSIDLEKGFKAPRKTYESGFALAAI